MKRCDFKSNVRMVVVLVVIVVVVVSVFSRVIKCEDFRNQKFVRKKKESKCRALSSRRSTRPRERYFAMRKVDLDGKDSFMREFRAMGRIASPHVKVVAGKKASRIVRFGFLQRRRRKEETEEETPPFCERKLL